MNEHEQILSEVLNCRRINLYVNPRALSLEEQQKLRTMKARRKQGEPLQYIIGHCDFMGTTILVDERVLIPRPETELLVNLALERMQASENSRYIKILDLGTGSGNISVVLAKNIDNCSITSIDISRDAMDIAIYNAKANFVDDKIEFICKDMETFFKQALGTMKFDLIISNPPYIQTSKLNSLPDDVKREPRLALDGGEDGLKFYRIIYQNACQFLEDDGLLMCEIGDDQSSQIISLFKGNSQYNKFELVKDYVGTDRIFFCKKQKTTIFK